MRGEADMSANSDRNEAGRPADENEDFESGLDYGAFASEEPDFPDDTLSAERDQRPSRTSRADAGQPGSVAGTSQIIIVILSEAKNPARSGVCGSVNCRHIHDPHKPSSRPGGPYRGLRVKGPLPLLEGVAFSAGGSLHKPDLLLAKAKIHRHHALTMFEMWARDDEYGGGTCKNGLHFVLHQS